MDTHTHTEFSDALKIALRQRGSVACLSVWSDGLVLELRTEVEGETDRMDECVLSWAFLARYGTLAELVAGILAEVEREEEAADAARRARLRA